MTIPMELQLDLLDVRGVSLRKLFSLRNLAAGSHSFRFDIGDLPDGVYVLSISNSMKAVARKVVKTGRR